MNSAVTAFGVSQPRFLAVGAAGVGFVYSIPRLPVEGETLLATSEVMMAGGKSCNQAIALAALGADVVLLGALGRDTLAQVVLATLEQHGVDASGILRLDGPTLTGTVLVEPDGSNRIVIGRGCQGNLVPADIIARRELFAHADVCLVGMDGFREDCAEAALELAREEDCVAIFNPAPPPSRSVTERVLPICDVLVPNLREAQAMANSDEVRADILAQRLHAMGASRVVITLGADGALVSDNGDQVHVATDFEGSARDTNGAGDAFNAALAGALGQGLPLVEAAGFACRSASLITQGPGLVGALQYWAGLELPQRRAAPHS